MREYPEGRSIQSPIEEPVGLKYPYGQNEQGSIYLSLDANLFSAFPQEVEWKGVRLSKKDEFHVTLLHAKQTPELSHIPNERLASLFESFVERNPMKFESFLEDLRFIEEGADKTIVARCAVSNLNELFAELNKSFGARLPVQAAHVTLYTLEKNKGIYINSDQQMENSERVRLPELETALSKIQFVA